MRGSLRKKACCRGDIKQWDQILEETEHDVGVIKNEKFSAFWAHSIWHCMVDCISKIYITEKLLIAKQKIRDYMRSTELISNSFRIS